MTVREKLAAGHYKNAKPFASISRDRAMYDAYCHEQARLESEFRLDLSVEHGVAGHHKETKLWELAWEHGHSCGLSEVVNYYEQFVELLK